MAAQGGIVFQEKVSRLLGKQRGKPVLKTNKTLALRDEVANRKTKRGEATCITEMSVMMACWKQNTFADSLCSNEMKAFYICVEKAQATRKATSEHTGIQGGSLHPKQATTLLKRFPNPRTEV